MIENTSVIAKTYALLDFSNSSNLATIETPPNSIYQSRLLHTISQKLNIDSVFFYQPPGGETSIPHILFSHLESVDKHQLTYELAELHKIAWNMARAPLLFATTPDGTIRIYNTYIPPSDPKPNSDDYQSGLIETLNIFNEAEAERLRQKYHRREFESGRFWQNNRKRFDIKNRADQTLLQNLRIMHRTLSEMLPDAVDSLIVSEITHNLIGRSIFIKYLEDRHDSKGNNVFSDGFFAQFVQGATCFTDVLLDKKGAYALFEYLKEKFNGDLFPVNPLELEHIQLDHLRELRLFLTGKTRLTDRQLRFWKFYSFDAIPIEFISNIYEEFFHITEQERLGKTAIKTGTHYTPHHLVEFLVDELFPWEGDQVDCKVLDPACGSGIFLVEIYRRLIAHWQQANPSEPIQFKHLKKLLVDNIYGVDLDSGAIQVAAFSLYLTLCDFLEPRQIWKNVTFPPLRNQNLFLADFFNKGKAFSDSKYDLIV
ncbi:MAG: N-6 DNA methylase, partial [Deltaproteobacteria bacterium]|nr:N-6 DNA methylase [Deltaproteobacteria bacterium]